ncbi:MAG: hypothetical protein P1V18_02365 [Candidatus Gracilibacteria bacterium]|nr:hypothetical protein [Candidatus Gracilibacteria bacterium]
MRSHLRKRDFKFVSISVMVLEVASFLVFIFGTLGAILGTYRGIGLDDFIILGFGGIFMSLVLMAMAEVLQIMMRIEHNTRKENLLAMESMEMQRQEVAATKQVAAAIKKPTKRKAASKKKAVRKAPAKRKAAVKRPTVRKVKPRKKK